MDDNLVDSWTDKLTISDLIMLLDNCSYVTEDYTPASPAYHKYQLLNLLRCVGGNRLKWDPLLTLNF